MGLDFDVAVLRAGFGGTLTALLLERIGLRPVLVERGTHPRFALGESATPVGDLVLADLAQRYGLPRVAPLAEYGSWQRAYPKLVCGLKRGFSYYHHKPGEPFVPGRDHAGELLVAASRADADADTHWLRSEFDQFLLREAQAANIAYFERTQVSEITGGPPWTLAARRGEEALRFRAAFIVDATGEGTVLSRQFAIPNHPHPMRTHSRTIYAHFRGVRHWHDMLRERGGRLDDHPFGCDDAALHHLLAEGGWLWVLRFNNGVTSAGFLLDSRRFPLDTAVPAEEEWRSWMGRYPSVAEQFADAELVAPAEGLRRTARLQRRAARAAGPGWAMLPMTAYSLDALHSSGNAHTLTAIERLIGILEASWNRCELESELARYDRTLQSEITLLDTLVHGCYLALAEFELFAAFVMCYFAAATTGEMRRRQVRGVAADAFLLATDRAFRAAVDRLYRRMAVLTSGGRVPADEVARYDREVADALRPFNVAGLCDPAKRNMYPYP